MLEFEIEFDKSLLEEAHNAPRAESDWLSTKGGVSALEFDAWSLNLNLTLEFESEFEFELVT